jgi:hypothetical protein
MEDLTYWVATDFGVAERVLNTKTVHPSERQDR